ncbi:unannotated protein [freshwater metagenome]|uniref:Unannotated protein n=1 Tax=freshwater metagenome TaxID=449393 RepID=A0A6J7JVI3_9ZZZZ
MPDTPVVDLDNLDDDGRYLRYHAARDESFPAYAQHRAEVRDLCELTRGMSVVEIGCGTGPHLPHLTGLVGTDGFVAGVDSSSKMLRATEQRLVGTGVAVGDGTGGSVKLEHSRLDDFASDRFFDVVIADRLIGHLPDPVGGLRQLGALCAAGGRVVVVNMLNAATTVNLGDGEHERELARRVLSWRSERGTTSAWAVGVLPSLAVRAGLVPTGSRLWSFACRSLAESYPHTPLLEYGAHAHTDGAINEEDAERWRLLLQQRDADGTFAAGIVIRADVLMKPSW